jgi:hypothetical protein
MRFCPNCGIPVGESPRYCAGCGTQVTPAGSGLVGSGPAGSGPAVRGPFDSAPLRLGPADATPAGSMSTATSSPSEQESWLPEELSAARSGEPSLAAGFGAGFGAGDPWPHHEPADPWTPADPPAGGGPVPVSTPPTWFDALSPVGHPQADGLAGAAPAASSRRAAPGKRRRAAWSGHRMTITAMAVTLALVGTAWVAVWQVSQLHAQPSVASDSMRTQPTGLATGTGHPGSTQPAAHGSAAPLPRASASPSATHRAGPAAPAAAVGNAVVAVAPLAAHVPHVRHVVALLTIYFESINSQNFAEYQSLFVPSIQRTMTPFGSGYAGTFDSGATLTQLVATGPHGLAATVAFISHQNPANSPDHAKCDSWLITLFLKRQGNALHIRHPRPGFPQSVLACH